MYRWFYNDVITKLNELEAVTAIQGVLWVLKRSHENMGLVSRADPDDSWMVEQLLFSPVQFNIRSV